MLEPLADESVVRKYTSKPRQAELQAEWQTLKNGTPALSFMEAQG